jgi:hypothetical protein
MNVAGMDGSGSWHQKRLDGSAMRCLSKVNKVFAGSSMLVMDL